MKLDAYPKQSDGFDVVAFIEGKAMIDPDWDDDQVLRFDLEANPVVRRCLWFVTLAWIGG